ncbi:MAG: hypothetical protein PHF44_04070 [Candidatus Pacebacteria bacterium]|nr:hypothetical protein [Candidatus Paceibacterota bacterium]
MWILVTILSYLILAIVFLIDKYLLKSSIPNPQVYVFYVGIAGILAVLLLPFVGFSIPQPSQIFLGLLAGAAFMFGLFWFYMGLGLFEASRIVPAVGGLTPFFTSLLIFIFSKGKEVLTQKEIFAFVLLILGSVLIVYEKGKSINLKSLKISLISSLFLSASFALIKYIYSVLPFWTGFILKSFGGFLAAILFFIIFPEIKKEIFKKRSSFAKDSNDKEKSSKKTTITFLGNQAMGAGGNILQNWAIALVPSLAFVAFVNALQGIQYVFLLIFTIFLSWKFPWFLKEEISKKIIFQKTISVLLISGGLILLLI